MRLLLALLAIATSVVMIGLIGLHDPKRVAAQSAVARRSLGAGQRRVLAIGAALPGLLLIVGGWWSAAMMWMGATVILLWLWVLWLSGRTLQRAR